MKNLFVKTLLVLFIGTPLISPASAQILKPVKWSYTSERISEKEAVLHLTAKIEKGWHLYSQFIPEGGPIATSFKFTKDTNYDLTGKVTEGKPEEIFDANFNMKLTFFSNTAIFKQKIKTNSNAPFKIKGTLEFMVCDDKQCLPPEEIPIELEVKGFDAIPNPAIIEPIISPIGTGNTPVKGPVLKPAPIPALPGDNSLETNSDMSGWNIFFAGFLGGLVALLTPCVFPMIPLTVSFFTKQAKNKSKAIANAFLYGVSIIVIYVALGFGVTKLLGGPDALNDLASNVYFNMAFFILLIIFAISFLGAFEIQLPSSWINKADAKSDRGGIIGIFFMAFTLALVSFSCTGPIIGTLLVQAAHSTNYMGPLTGMTGFSLALALPFTLFAAFPSWMHSLPKSGGWLNSVKVVLGFLELAFALKFLSNVDLAYHWRILDREVFLVLWVVIFTLLGLYLLGKLKFSHDSDLKYVGLPRFFLALFSFAFALYMVPGLWGAPLKAISAFTPPQASLDFDLMNAPKISSGEQVVTKKNDHLFHCPHNLNCFFDYNEGMAYAKKTGKPVMLDFTGWSCANCRKMEASVWSDPAVLKRLNEEYVIISLYVDDKTPLPKEEQYPSAHSNKIIKTLGNKWSELQTSKFNINSQPYYVLLDHQEKVLVTPQGYDMDIDHYIQFLDNGIKAFKK